MRQSPGTLVQAVPCTRAPGRERWWELKWVSSSNSFKSTRWDGGAPEALAPEHSNQQQFPGETETLDTRVCLTGGRG